MSKISVIVPAYNEEKFISVALQSIKMQSRPADEILVIDNNSTDNTVKIAKKFGAKVITEKRQGPQFAVATGFIMASGDIVCATDADTIVPSDWIERIEEIIGHKRCAITGPCVYPDAPAPIQFGVEVLPKFYGFGYRGELIGANFAFWKDFYREIGGVSTDFASWDIDLGDKARKAGKLYYDPNLVVSTSGRRFNDNNIAKVLTKYYLNYLGVKLKMPDLISKFPYLRDRLK